MTTISQLPDTSLSILSANLSNHIMAWAVVGGFFLAIGAAIIYYASPLRLTRVLAVAITNTEKCYLEALEMGVLLSSDVETAKMLSCLQLKVSTIREGTLRSSLSTWTVLRDFFTGRSLTVLLCIWSVQELETNIEILKETQLRKNNLNPLTVSLRRRRAFPGYT
ncbi:hypothetical protein MVEN_00976800 [Mycena venus]|uniref:Uncharacterized protein n=1 Tax=Mycena venus TaxID=2733690 RepID=A0A8H7CZK3_9AGAR|nr:hypothetical protein MVEN_00976800 [Mycena venus]